MAASDSPHFSTIDISRIKFGPGVSKKCTGGSYIEMTVKYPGVDYFSFRTGLYDIKGYKLAAGKGAKSNGEEKYRLVVPLEDATEEQVAFKKFLNDFDAAFVDYCTEQQIFDATQAFVAKQPYRAGLLVNQPRKTVEGSNVKVEVAKPRLYAACVSPEALPGKNGKTPPPTEFCDIGKVIIPWSKVQKCSLTGYLVFRCSRATVTASSSGVGVDLGGMIVTAAKVAPRGTRLGGLIDELFADKEAALAEAAKLRKELDEALALDAMAEEANAELASDSASNEPYVPPPRGISDELFREIEAMSP